MRPKKALNWRIMPVSALRRARRMRKQESLMHRMHSDGFLCFVGCRAGGGGSGVALSFLVPSLAVELWDGFDKS